MRTNNGFTIIELMVTLAVAAILISVAVPSFTDLIRSNRAATQANELVTGLNLARSEAVKRGLAVSICPSSNGTTCAGGTSWSGGWLVFADLNGDGARAAGTEPVLRVWGTLGGGSTLIIDSGSSIVFQRLGDVSAARSFTLTVAGCTGNQRRMVNVNAVGRIEAQTAACS